jgi:ABC-2 type transport system permease protein
MLKRFKRLRALIQKETIQLLRDRRTLAIMLISPVVALLLLAYAVDLTVDHIPMAVADMSKDARSRALVDALVASDYYDVAMYVDSEAAVIRAIDEGRVRAGLVIPAGFATRVKRGDAQALILLDGSDSFTVQSGYAAAAAVSQAQAMALTVEKVERMGASIGSLPITSSTRILYNPDIDDMIFMMPMLAAILMQLAAFNMTAVSVARERELGTIEQILVTAARPIELMISKIVPNIGLTVIVTLIIIATGIYWFQVPFKGNVWLFAWLSILFIISGLGLGLLVSTVAKTQNQAQQVTGVILLLSILLTGFVYPREPMPPVARFIGNLIPLTYFGRIIRGIFTKGVGLTFLWEDVLALVFYVVAVVALAWATFKRRLD